MTTVLTNSVARTLSKSAVEAIGAAVEFDANQSACRTLAPLVEVVPSVTAAEALMCSVETILIQLPNIDWHRDLTEEQVEIVPRLFR